MSEDPAGLPSGIAPGSRLAGYLLREQIGRGGMSVVFAALDEHLGRLVALKILAPEIASDAAFRERFVRESRAAAAVDSPHIIPVYEAGEAAGMLFISMRLVRGGDAKSLVTQYGPQPPARVAEIVSQVASALDAAHHRGLVHRDVKPANMLLAEAEQLAGRDHVYLSDFGLTKGSLEVTGLTAAGQFMGTLNYVSPEQISGRPVDGRADQYALACSAFELLTGQPPFARDEPTAVMYAQLNDPPPALTALRPGLPPELNVVFARALAKQPQDRFSSCRDFAAAIRSATGPWLSGSEAIPGAVITRSWRRPPDSEEPVSAPTAMRPAGLPGDTPVTMRSPRRPVAVAAVALIVLAGLGGGAAFWTLRHHSAAPRHRQHQSTGPTQPAVSVSAPGCSQSVGTASYQDLTPSTVVSVPEPPYGAVLTGDDNFTFVALPHSIEVFRNQNGAPAGPPVGRIAVPDHPHAQALNPDNTYLVTATNHGAVVISVTAAETGRGRVVVGFLSSGLPGNPGGDDLALSADGRFVFEAMRWADKIAVYNLAKALSAGFGPADLVGYIPAGVKPHGMLVSADNQWLYVANRFAQAGRLEGSVSLFSVPKAETDPARSFVSSALVGCGAYRIISSPDGLVLWVIAQSSNAVVGVSASRLRTNPAHAILTTVRVGPIPLDEVLVDGGTKLLVTDNSGASVAVVDTASALAKNGKGLVGFVRTTPLPRFFAYSPGATYVLLVTGDVTGQIRSLKVDRLP